MDAKRCGIWRPLILSISLAGIGAVVFLAPRGVREIRPVAQVAEPSTGQLEPAPDDWPCWRGQSHANVVISSHPPLQWSVSENIAWRTAVEGRGHSSPCLWHDRIFLTTSDAKQQTILLLSFDRETGRILWQTEIHRGGLMTIHQKNSYASSTVACDGRFVYVTSQVHGAIWASAVDFQGNVTWQTNAGPYSSEWGYGSSPAMFQSLLIVAGDNRGEGVDRLVGSSWMAGLERTTGKIVWRIKRPDGDSFGSPVVARVAGRDQLVISGKDGVYSYVPATGECLWKCRSNTKRTANTLVFDDQRVYASTRQPQGEIICIRADGDGDVTDTHVVWRERKSASDVPSPCLRDGHLLSVTDEGVLTCLNADDGKTVWKKRLGGNFSSSPLIAGQHLFCCNEEGQTFVIDLESRGDVIAENRLNDGIMASPVITGDRLYVRTLTSLYCLSARSPASLAEKPAAVDQRLSH